MNMGDGHSDVKLTKAENHIIKRLRAICKRQFGRLVIKVHAGKVKHLESTINEDEEKF